MTATEETTPATNAAQENALENLAQEVRRRAGLEDEHLELVTKMATRLLGPGAVRLNTGMRGAAYLNLSTAGSPYIVVNPTADDLRFNIAHEIGEWALATIAKFRGSHLERERCANFLAGAILAPAAALLRIHAAVGENMKAIADQFGISRACAFLRLGEVLGDERAVVTRSGQVLVRTQGAFPWADAPVVDVARGRAWGGLSRLRLRGHIDEGRVGLIARRNRPAS